MQPHSHSGASVAASAAKLILAGAVVTTLTVFAQEAQAQRKNINWQFRCSYQASKRYGLHSGGGSMRDYLHGYSNERVRPARPEYVRNRAAFTSGSHR